MLPKHRRITRHSFPNDPRAGRVIHAPHLSLRVTRGTTQASQVSVIVSKRTAHRAVDRHSIKRRVYEAVARFEKTTPIPNGQYVFFAKKDADTIAFKELYEEVVNLLLNDNISIVRNNRFV